MKNKTTHYLIILDKSGSMQDCKDQAISSYNEQLESIQNLQKEFPEQDFTISLTVFNNYTDHIYFNNNPKKSGILNDKNYRPNGMTSLYDAIGKSVTKLQHKVGKAVANDLANVVVIIITDGYENSSKEYSYKHISSMIRELESTCKYTFSYLGSTLDAVDIAQKLNIKRKNAMKFDKEDYKRTTTVLNKSYMAMAMKKRNSEENYDDFLNHE